MKVLTGIIILALSVIGITSCQREIDWELNNSTQSDSSYLSKYIILDTTLPVGSDTVSKAFLTYDNSKRLSRLHAYNVGTIDSFTYDFRYSGSDSLPYLIVERGTGYNGPGTSYIDSFFLTYSNGIVKGDSSIQWIYPSNTHDETFARAFSISGSVVRVYEREYGYISGVLTLFNFDSSFYNVGFSSGNLSALTLLSGPTAFYQSVQVTYDNKYNPLGKVIKFRFNSFENEIFNEWNIQGNNPMQVQYQQVFNPMQTEQYTYIYRADGYPVSLTYFESLGVTNYNKIIFIYTSL